LAWMNNRAAVMRISDAWGAIVATLTRRKFTF
jgi:hypothetical protein